MKNTLQIIGIVLSLLILVPDGFGQEETASSTSVAVEAIEGESNELPGMAEINQRKALAELRRIEIANAEDERGIWLGFVMPFAAFVFVLCILGIIFGYERKKDRNRHETIRVYLEKGMEVPHELLIDEDHPSAKKPTSDLRKGIIWLCVGLGISLTVMIVLRGDRGAAVGLIPIFIGIGYIVAAKLDPKPVDNND